MLTVLLSTLKPIWWNELVWAGCHRWPSEMLLSEGSSAVQDPLCLFFMLVLQPCFKNAADEPQSPFFLSKLLLQWVWWSGFPSSLGLVVSLSSLKPENWWRLEVPECVRQRLTSAWLWGVSVCVCVCMCVWEWDLGGRTEEEERYLGHIQEMNLFGMNHRHGAGFASDLKLLFIVMQLMTFLGALELYCIPE